jgi:ADP-heptose:LPS heptosyltransferase
MIQNLKRIIISRTDAIGDVILSLPMAGFIKKQNPNIEIIFLGKDYTEHIVRSSSFVDIFLSWDKIKDLEKTEQISTFLKLDADAIIHVFPNKTIANISKKAKIKYRIGTSHRPYHWLTCNKQINLGRKNSNLHESQLNIKLLAGLGIDTNIALNDIPPLYGFTPNQSIPKRLSQILDKDKFNLILHPKSHGSAREWGINNFTKLVELLDESRFKIFITGTEKEREDIGDLLKHPKVTDLTAQLNLQELIAFISNTDGLIAASTGPLHIASAFGKKAIGIYPPIRPMHPERWAPIGKNADYLVVKKSCNDCKDGSFCHCIQEVTPEHIIEKLANNG